MKNDKYDFLNTDQRLILRQYATLQEELILLFCKDIITEIETYHKERSEA